MENCIVILFNFVVVFVICFIYYKFKLEEADYYECSKCHYKFKHNYKDVIWFIFNSLHIRNISRYTMHLKCPKCGERAYGKYENKR